RSYSTQEGYFECHSRINELFKSSLTFGPPIGTRIGTGPLVWGEHQSLEIFEGLALQAGKALPSFLRIPVRLFPVPAPVFPNVHDPEPNSRGLSSCGWRTGRISERASSRPTPGLGRQRGRVGTRSWLPCWRSINSSSGTAPRRSLC